tara:strand:+ start:1806 stop:2258 length:453 start_codon:yes stop_codon:yes gene_type:complete
LDTSQKFKIEVKLTLYSIFFFCFLSCNAEPTFTERNMMIEKINAFQFLSNYHHQLHVMIGEEEGDIKNAFDELLTALSSNNNPELIPIKKAVMRIDHLNKEALSVRRLDYLVDYYQSGLSIQIEGVMRGYGYLESFAIEDALALYDGLNK